MSKDTDFATIAHIRKILDMMNLLQKQINLLQDRLNLFQEELNTLLRQPIETAAKEEEKEISENLKALHEEALKE